MKTATIRPGLLVALKSSVTGGVSYQRKDIEHDASRARWETTRTIEDPVEHERAIKARSRALREVRAVCSPTSFGLLCPVNLEPELNAAIRRARDIVDEHNDGAVFTQINIYVLKGRIADTDEEAARAIGQEVAELVAGMNSGIDRLDPKAIRDAASKARQMAAMLTEEQSGAVSEAIKQARKAARQIVKRVEKEGEQAAVVLADIQRGAIEKARIAFLDLEDRDEEEQESLPAVNRQRFADLDVSSSEVN